MSDSYSICCPHLHHILKASPSVHEIPEAILKAAGHIQYADKSAASDLRSAAPEHSAIMHGRLCLPSLNLMQMTPGCYRITTHPSTHIRRVDYNSVFFFSL